MERGGKGEVQEICTPGKRTETDGRKRDLRQTSEMKEIIKRKMGSGGKGREGERCTLGKRMDIVEKLNG